VRDVIYKGHDTYYLAATTLTGANPAAGVTLSTDGNSNTYGPDRLAVDAWTHLAQTFDGHTVRLFVNGVEVASARHNGTLVTSTFPLEIGGDSLYGQYFSGFIDEVRVYNVARTAVQIQADLNTPIGPAVNPPPAVADLTVVKTHSGTFTQGQTGAAYTVRVSNVGAGRRAGW
jgi:hypothetical protein